MFLCVLTIAEHSGTFDNLPKSYVKPMLCTAHKTNIQPKLQSCGEVIASLGSNLRNQCSTVAEVGWDEQCSGPSVGCIGKTVQLGWTFMCPQNMAWILSTCHLQQLHVQKASRYVKFKPSIYFQQKLLKLAYPQHFVRTWNLQTEFHYSQDCLLCDFTLRSLSCRG